MRSRSPRSAVASRCAGWASVLCAAVVGCGGPASQLRVEAAPDFKPGARTLSVLGVFRDGRMSEETWTEIGPRFAAALGSSACGSAYGSDLLQARPELYEAIEDYTKNEGITDALLGQLAPAATGDIIVLLIMNGRIAPANAASTSTAHHPHSTKHATATAQASPSGGSGSGGGGGRHRGHGRHSGSQQNSGDVPRAQSDLGDVLELSAVLYSVPQHQSVAAIDMRYTGTKLDEALAALNAELQRKVPGRRAWAGIGREPVMAPRRRSSAERWALTGCKPGPRVGLWRVAKRRACAPARRDRCTQGGAGVGAGSAVGAALPGAWTPCSGADRAGAPGAGEGSACVPGQ